MHNKLKGALAATIISFMPFLVFSKQIETQISADSITAQNGQILLAQGNVLIQHGKNQIKAEALEFNQKTNQIKFTNLQDFYDGNAIKLSADQASINSDLSEGIIFAANLLLDDVIKIETDEVRILNSEIYSAKGISRVTSCEECEGKEPNWYLTASSAKRDIENSNIVYKNVTVRVRGLPVAYIPYLRMPDPSVERARGFLVPEAVLTSNLATGLKLPYFIPIGSSSDFLITPYFSSKTKTLEYRYRKKFRSGDFTVKGAFSDDDLAGRDLRYFSQIVGHFDLGYGFDLNFNAGKVSDTSYLGDYVYNEESDLNSEISLGKTVVGKKQFFDGDLTYLREKENGNSLDEYYSLLCIFVRDIYPANWPGKIRLSANLNSSVNVNDDNSVSRPPSSAQVGLDFSQLNSLGSVELSSNFFGKFNSFVNSANSGTTNEEFSFKYGALTSISAPRFINGNGKILFFNPKIALSWTGQENDIKGEYFKGPEELSWANVYSGEKIYSITESETGLSMSLGFTSQVFWNNGPRLEVSLAASKINGLTYSPASSFGLAGRKLNYLAKFFFEIEEDSFVSSDVLLSSEGRLLRGDIRGKYTHEQINFGARYEVLDQIMDDRLSDDLRIINISSSYNFFDSFLLNVGGRYDLNGDQMRSKYFGFGGSLGSWDYNLTQEYLQEEREKFSLSAIYDDECTRLKFSFENRFRELGSSKPIKSLMFRVQLKPFANVVFSQGRDQITF